MPGASRPTAVYRISKWRQGIGWLIFGPLIAFMWGLALLVELIGNDKGAEGGNAVLWVMGALFALVAAGLTFWVRRARLEVSPEGVKVTGVGTTLETAWSNLLAVRLTPGTEGLITAEPMTGKGPVSMAKVSGFSMYGAPIYDDEKRALIDAYRFIPIEAFACHLKPGGKLRDDLLQHAPQLRPTLEGTHTVDYWAGTSAPAAEPVPVDEAVVAREAAEAKRKNRRTLWLTLAICLPAASLAFLPPPILNTIFHYLFLILAPLLALRAGYSAWNCFQKKAWVLGTIFVLMTVLLCFWAMGLWMGAE